MGSINIKFFLGCLIYLVGFSLIVSFIIAEMSMGSMGSINLTAPPNPLPGTDPISQAANTANYIGYIMSLMGSIILWTLPEAIFPFWANFLFVKSVVIALVVQLVWGLIP